jgi:hypothetical protein
MRTCMLRASYLQMLGVCWAQSPFPMAVAQLDRNARRAMAACCRLASGDEMSQSLSSPSHPPVSVCHQTCATLTSSCCRYC